MSLLLSSAKQSIFSIPAQVVLASPDNPTTATLSFNTNGSYTGTVNGRWYAPPATVIGNDFEIYAEEVGGPAGFTGTFDSWLSLDSVRTWSLQKNGIGVVTGNIIFRIRRIGDTNPAIEGQTYWEVEVTV